MNKLTGIIKGLAANGRVFSGEEYDPKKEGMVGITPLHPTYYYKSTALDFNYGQLDKVIIKRNGDFFSDVNTINFVSSRLISQEEAEELCRCSFAELGFVRASILVDVNGVEVVEVRTKFGSIMPITFPYKESLAGIFTNSKGETAYVMCGRGEVKGDNFIVPSINQEAISKFMELYQDNPRIRLSKVLSDELWQLSDEIEYDEETGEPIIIDKAIIWLSSCKYGMFPRTKSGMFYNTVWNKLTKEPLTRKIIENPALGKIIRISSLSQNGVTAQAGEVIYDPETCCCTFKEVKRIKGNKGKLDISGTRGPKIYKQVNKQKVLVALCSPTKTGMLRPTNAMGNVLVTKTAFQSYVTNQTFDLMKERNFSKGEIPSHKIFIETDEEVVRIKGAASVEEITATLPNGYIEDKVILLPAVELNTKGRLEEDLDKFKYLCQYSGEQVFEVTVEIYGRKYKVPAMYLDIYEDAEHSGLATSSLKDQNKFYYGALMIMYQMNGLKELKRAISEMLDNKQISNVMNSISTGKEAIEKLTYSEFINQL